MNIFGSYGGPIDFTFAAVMISSVAILYVKSVDNLYDLVVARNQSMVHTEGVADAGPAAVDGAGTAAKAANNQPPVARGRRRAAVRTVAADDEEFDLTVMPTRLQPQATLFPLLRAAASGASTVLAAAAVVAVVEPFEEVSMRVKSQHPSAYWRLTLLQEHNESHTFGREPVHKTGEEVDFLHNFEVFTMPVPSFSVATVSV